ncbi:4'-phosphopantetheinyl transferase [Microtetraspora sp. NBRC 13810]|uniref:4'-phosphopantetheinyl transferase family protein n=1 Tax=Microtetraspora sp. NBRC 13810 TaxID=3030990 RepID=UPI0024A3EF66|nr:4'-phosphopantetheinyl transferase superfamily protein [Microtetraspora sp. NBRC 13810]GLW09199.1 4'-phosphopantetheinyl transferase [Microtetraspora sp. NBRC 13810]
MLEEILPSSVRVAEAFGDEPAVALFPEEEALVARASGKRRGEFATARACARRALAGLGLPPVAIPAGEDGAPRWPDGVVGSMTHCRGYRAAAVALAGDVTTVGIDAEPALPLPPRILDKVAGPREQAMLARLKDPSVCWDRLLFCVKEAVYKAWFPLTGSWLGFLDAVVELDPGGTFGVVIPGRTPGGFDGRWATGHGLLLAAIAVEATGDPGPELDDRT